MGNDNLQNFNQNTPFSNQNSNDQTSESPRFVSKTEIVKDGEAGSDEIEHRTNGLVKETQLIATWLYQKTANTRSAYESDIKKFLSFYPGKTLRDFSTAHIGVFLKENSQMKESSLARIKSSLSSLFKFCVRLGYLDKNPAENLDPIKVADQTQFRVLAHEEILRMIEFELNPRNKTIIRLLYKTGIRVSELCSLRFSNLRERESHPHDWA